MAGDGARMIEQRAGKRAHLAGREGAIRGRAQIGVPPLPIGRQEARQRCDRRRIEAKPAGIGQRQRAVEVEPDVAGAPCVLETHIDEVRGKGELELR